MGTGPAPQRLRRRAEFLAVARVGRKLAKTGFVLQWLDRGDGGPCRIGFTVTRKIGNAVARNRVRRRLREAVRLVWPEHAPSGVDLVLVGRAGTASMEFASLTASLAAALASGARA